MTPDEFIHVVTENTQRWIADQREVFFPNSVALPAQDESRLALSRHFTSETLDRARFAVTERIPNPVFVSGLSQPGEPLLIDFSEMSGITFVDTVVLARWPGPASLALVAHELVHVVQYGILGLPEFARQYVRGWAENGMQYESIPLEVQAYEIEKRFIDPNQPPFSVEDAVQRQLERSTGG